MRVYYKGFNLYSQFSCGSEGLSRSVIEDFISCDFDCTLEQIQVTHTFCAQLTCDGRLTVKHSSTAVPIGQKYVEHVFQCISCCDRRVLALTRSGELYSIDANKWHTIRHIPIVLDGCDRIQKIACGVKLAVAITKTGQLFNIPNRLTFKATGDVVDVVTGREHCLLLDSNGNVFSFGNGSRGQLGTGALEESDEPATVEALAGIRIVKIAAGGWHSCAISVEGDLYAWGWNCNGQLGVEDGASVVALPQAANFDDPQVTVKDVACGSRHTIVLLTAQNGANELWGCGWNKYKQLKCVNEENILKWTYLCSFPSEQVIGVQCGPWSSMVLCRN